MRLRDDTPLDPEVIASLDAIDAVLAGEPVDPRHAELAELALLLAGERRAIDTAFATLLDEGVQRRFAAGPAKAPRPRRRAWLWGPAAGLATAMVVAVVVLASGGRSGSSPSLLHVTTSSSSASASPTPAGKVPVPSAGYKPAVPTAARTPSFDATSRSAPAASAGAPAPAALSRNQTAVLQPPSNGRKIVQSAQLALTTAPSRVDAVAQEVFDVVGQERGVVKSSNVTATGGPGGYAQFELSIPSSALPQTMAALSTLRYARVASRTDTTQDVNDQYQSDARALAEARALRTSLLKQLANAGTAAQTTSLTTQIHDADASISSDEASLRSLGHQIAYSQVSLTINGGLVPVPAHGNSSSGFTLHQAAHDAGRVLTVAAGVVLIGLAALVPLALLGAMGSWILVAVRRRRREQALDLA